MMSIINKAMNKALAWKDLAIIFCYYPNQNDLSGKIL